MLLQMMPLQQEQQQRIHFLMTMEEFDEVSGISLGEVLLG
jgi:hypothetical protein